MKYLDFILYKHLCLGRHIDPSSRSNRSDNSNVHVLCKVKHLPMPTDFRMLLKVMVMSRMDYTNCIVSGRSNYQCSHLQVLQNDTPWFGLWSKTFDQVYPLLISLHWLPVDAWIFFKLACTIC